jgi:hypothetical protein
MVLRSLNLFILLSIAVGAYLLVSARAEQHEVRQEYDLLVGKVGLLEITDETKIHIAALKTDDPFEFAWRVYIPKGVALKRTTKSITGGSSTGYPRDSDGSEVVWRTRLRFNREKLQIFNKYSHGSSLTGSGNKKVVAFLKAHADELRIEHLAEDGPASYDAHQVLTLLKIEIPEHLRDDALKVWKRSATKDTKLPPFFQVQIGTKAAFAAAESQQ